MTYIELINRFWDMHRRNHFTAGEMCLYFFLLDYANRCRWMMPLSCPTPVVSSMAGISITTVQRARVALRDCGLISFTEGVQNSAAPQYTILGLENKSRERGGERGGECGGECGGERYIKDKDKELINNKNKKFKNLNYEHKRTTDKRRGVDIHPEDTRDYHTTF